MEQTHIAAPQGVHRTAALNTRARILELTEQLAVANARADKAEREAYSLAMFIKERAGASVWDHADVMQILQDTVVTICAGSLLAVNRAEREGVPATYTLFREVVISRFERARATLLDKIGHPGERGAVNSPELITDRMKEDLRNTVRLPNVA